MQDDSGRQAGWYAVGGALVAAGCALFSLGLASTPRSKTLEFLGLVGFVAGLAIIICAMNGRQAGNREIAKPVASRSTHRMVIEEPLRPGSRKDRNTASPTTIIPNNRPDWPRSQLIAVAASMLIIGVGGFAIFSRGSNRTNQGAPSPMLSEEHMVSLLIPGDNYDRLQQIIGQQPDLQQVVESGNILYQFNRPWEYVDLLVSAGRTLSVGVYAKTIAFKPSLNASGYSVALNGSTIAQQAGYVKAVGAVGNCGGNIGASFFEGFALPMANEQASFVLGWVQSRTLNIPQAACAAEFPVNACDRSDRFGGGLSPEFLTCLNSSKIGQDIAKLHPSVVIATAPGQSILPAMLDYGPLSIGSGL